MLSSRISPSGMRLASPATIAWTCAVPLLHAREDGRCQPDRQRQRKHDEPDQQAIVGSLEGRAGVPERPRSCGQLLRAAVRADRLGFEQPGSFDRERTRPDRVSLVAQDELRLAGEIGLIDGEPVGRHKRSVSHDLVACRDSNRVTDDHILDRQRDVVAVAHHDRLGCDQRREPVELALGADLLERPDRDVRDDDAEKERVTPGVERERQDSEHDEDHVRDGQRVCADDAGVGTTGLAAQQPTPCRSRRAVSMLLSPARADRDRLTRRPSPIARLSHARRHRLQGHGFRR